MQGLGNSLGALTQANMEHKNIVNWNTQYLLQANLFWFVLKEKYKEKSRKMFT